MRFILIHIQKKHMTTSRFPAPAASSASRLTPGAAAVRFALAAAMLAGPAAFAQTAAPAETTTLQEVKIIGLAERGYVAKSTSTATKTDTLLRDTPQAITVVTKELIRDQAMQSMADVLRYVPGIVTAQGEGNRDTAVFRGNSSTGDFFIDGIRDDVQYYRDFYNIDSVEALKGSNAMIFGRGGSGGVINRVSKLPQWSTVREGSLTLGSWKNRRATVDVGQAVNDSVAVRVNAMAEDSDSYRNGVNIRRAGINPTVAIRAGANTGVVLSYEHFRDDRTADRGISSFNGAPFETDASTFFGSAALSPTWARVDAFTAVIEHDLGNGATLRNRTRYADYDKFYQNIYASSVIGVRGGVQKLDLGGYNNATQRTNLFNQTDLTFALNTGSIRHKLATGLEFGRQVTDNFRNTAFFTANGKESTAYEVTAANPAFNAPVTFRQAASDANNHGTATVASLYAQDQVEFTPHWQAIVGLRYDRFNVDFLNNRNAAKFDITDSKVSPRVGLVYKPVEAVSIYGSYSLAFVPRAGDQLSSLTPSNAAFDPEKFKNLELGAKWDIRPNLSATAAIYRLDRSNVVVTNPADATRSILVDGQRSKGVELGLGGNVTPQWNVMGGYAWQDAKLTAATSAAIPAGTTVPQVPTHSLSLWNRYDFTPTFGAGLGVAYRDGIFTSTSNKVRLPAFTRVDAALYYALSNQFKLQLNIENLFDKQYYASANSDTNITPGSPRALRVSLHAKF
jgi:catecholate siderophore receptor